MHRNPILKLPENPELQHNLGQTMKCSHCCSSWLPNGYKARIAEEHRDSNMKIQGTAQITVKYTSAF